jgi:hypothetical protein
MWQHIFLCLDSSVVFTSVLGIRCAVLNAIKDCFLLTNMNRHAVESCVVAMIFQQLLLLPLSSIGT